MLSQVIYKVFMRDSKMFKTQHKIKKCMKVTNYALFHLILMMIAFLLKYYFELVGYNTLYLLYYFLQMSIQFFVALKYCDNDHWFLCSIFETLSFMIRIFLFEHGQICDKYCCRCNQRGFETKPYMQVQKAMHFILMQQGKYNCIQLLV